MTDEEKARAFDKLCIALTNKWWDDKWTWWCCTLCGGETKRETREEAIVDLIAWSERIFKIKAKKNEHV